MGRKPQKRIGSIQQERLQQAGRKEDGTEVPVMGLGALLKSFRMLNLYSVFLRSVTPYEAAPTKKNNHVLKVY